MLRFLKRKFNETIAKTNERVTINGDIVTFEIRHVLHYYETDNAKYYVRETTDEFLYDVKIWRENKRTGKGEYILNDEIFNDGLGRCCGDSFSSFMVDVKNQVTKYITNKKEIILMKKDYPENM